jgi:hypothetical protein
MPRILKHRWMLLWCIPLVALLAWTQVPANLPAGQDDFCECDGCTSILVGKAASVDGSTMTSHSCDSNTDRTWIDIVPRRKHNAGELAPIYYESKRTKGPNDDDRIETARSPR